MDEKKITRRKLRIAKQLSYISLLLSYAMASYYMVVQWQNKGLVEDPFFIGILAGNTFLIAYLLGNAGPLFRKQHEEINSRITKSDKEVPLESLLNHSFELKGMAAFGILLSLIFFFFLSFNGEPGHSTVIKRQLALFVGSSNILTGFGIYVLIRYFLKVNTYWSNADVGLWNRNCKIVQFIMKTNKKMVLLITFICFMALLSLRFSDYFNPELLIVFTIWTLLFLLFTLIFPMIPLSLRMQEIKSALMVNYGEWIEKQLNVISSDPECTSEDQLRLLREWTNTYDEIRKVRVFPPIGSKFLGTGVIVSFITLTPAIVDLLVRYFMN